MDQLILKGINFHTKFISKLYVCHNGTVYVYLHDVIVYQTLIIFLLAKTIKHFCNLNSR